MDQQTMTKARKKFLRKMVSLEKRRHTLMLEEDAIFGELYDSMGNDDDDPPSFFQAVRVWLGEHTILPEEDPTALHPQD